jgi:hypothetical protein
MVSCIKNDLEKQIVLLSQTHDSSLQIQVYAFHWLGVPLASHVLSNVIRRPPITGVIR